jgi:hypothetical protein
LIEGQESNSQLDPWSLYLYAMKSPITKRKYQKRLSCFFEYIGLTGTIEEQARLFARKGSQDSNWAFNCILKFVKHQLERVNRKEIRPGTLRNYVKSIKLFSEMADLQISWKKITKGLPKERRYADDRVPSIDEIKRIMEYPDRRIKAIVLTMASGGLRPGAWDYLKWDNIVPIEKDGELVAANIIVYYGEEDEYFSFITPEAYRALENWMKYREESGEIITKESWLMRDLWDVSKPRGIGLVTKPKKLAALGLKTLMERAIRAQGLRKKLEDGKRRHPFQANHSYRKWFKTRCEISGMLPINVETLLSHQTGISDSYYRPTENDLLQDYLRSVDSLTIQKDETALQKQITEMEEKSKDNEYILKAWLQETNTEIQTLKSQVTSVLEVLKLTKSKDGRLGNDRTALDSKRRIAFSYVDDNDQIVDIKIPIGSVEVGN